MGEREVSVAFAEAFCSGDLDTLASLLAPNFRLSGPLFRFDSRASYLRSLRQDPPERGRCSVLHASRSSDEAAVLYEYRKSDRAVLVAQFTRLRGGLIEEIRLVFDTAQM